MYSPSRPVRALSLLTLILMVLLATAGISPDPASAAPAGQGATTTYTVQLGDTLSAIAQRFGTTVAEIQRLNGIENPNQIFAGQQLLIPVSGELEPTPEAPPDAQRIQFAPGATSTWINGSVGPEQAASYVVGASRGQTMMVYLQSATGQVFLTISGLSDGQVLVRHVAGATSWSGKLPASQDYLVQAVSVGGASTFSMQVTIPVDIRFRSGATSATMQGRIGANEIRHYVINVARGQSMMVRIDSPTPLEVTVFGQSDSVLYLDETGSFDYWTEPLPRTQDYLIEVISAGTAANYALTVVVPANIRFQPGTYGTSVRGTVAARATNTYLLRARAGQTMSVNIVSPGRNVYLTIYGREDGQPLVRATSGATSWTGRLPATQDYVIQAVSGGTSTSYTINVTVR